MIRRKVCHITSVHSRYDVRILHKQCVSLGSAGYDVTLVVSDDLPDEFIKGIRILSTGRKSLNRLERMLRTSLALFRRALMVDADIYHLHDPELLPVAYWLKKKGKRVIFDAHEDVPSQIQDKLWLPQYLRRLVAFMYLHLERLVCGELDAVIGVTPHIVERYSKINHSSVLVTNFPITVSDERLLPATPESAICFAGGITPQWQHVEIIQALKLVDGVTYLLAGRGDEQYLTTLRRMPAWKSVEYVGSLPHEQVRALYARAMVGVAINNSTQLNNEGTMGNTKLFEYMGAGLPVICSRNRLWDKIITKHDCGLCVDPRNVSEIAHAIAYIVGNPERAREMGKRARDAALSEYNWKTQEKALLELYGRIAGHGSPAGMVDNIV